MDLRALTLHLRHLEGVAATAARTDAAGFSSAGAYYVAVPPSLSRLGAGGMRLRNHPSDGSGVFVERSDQHRKVVGADAPRPTLARKTGPDRCRMSRQWIL